MKIINHYMVGSRIIWRYEDKTYQVEADNGTYKTLKEAREAAKNKPWI